LQLKLALTQTDWVNTSNPVIATNDTATASAVIGPDPQRFYRVQLLP